MPFVSNRPIMTCFDSHSNSIQTQLWKAIQVVIDLLWILRHVVATWPTIGFVWTIVATSTIVGHVRTCVATQPIASLVLVIDTSHYCKSCSSLCATQPATGHSTYIGFVRIDVTLWAITSPIELFNSLLLTHCLFNDLLHNHTQSTHTHPNHKFGSLKMSY